MKGKQWLSVLMVLLLCLVFTACKPMTDKTPDKPSDGDSAQASDISPLLYEVTDPDTGNKIWLFGSIHIGTEDFYPLPDYVMEAFETADSLAVEVDIVAFEKDLVGQMKALSTLVYTDGTTIRDHISAETYDKAVEILEENHLYNSAYDSYLPVFWQSLIANLMYEDTDADPKLGIDRHMIQAAYDREKEVLSIESAAEQYQVMAGLSEELQALLLEDALRQYAMPTVQKMSINMLLAAWKTGNADMLEQLLNETEGSEISADLYAEYMDEMITQRNFNMTDYAEEKLLSGEEVFICVGAAHVVGSDAMADLLAEAGYTVEVKQE